MYEMLGNVPVLKPCDSNENLGSRVLVWPVEVISLTAMVKKELSDILNPFEKLVLDFLQADPHLSVSQLAKEIFVPEDFLMCIYRRLQDKHLLSESYTVRDELSKNKDDRPIPGKAFRDLVTGRFLPYVIFGTMVPTISVRPNSRTYVMKAKKGLTGAVTITDIAQAFQLMKARSQVKLNLPDIKHVRLSSTQDKAYLYCVLQFDEHDGEIRVLNPFTTKGNEFEGTLEEALREVLKQDEALSSWLLEWRRSLQVGDIQQAIPTKRASYDNEHNCQLYPQLVSALNRSRTPTYESIYAVIEWALYYADIRVAGINPRQVFSKFNESFNRSVNLIKGGEIGLPASLINTVNESNFKRYRSGKPDMITALLVSQERATLNPNHPFNLLLQSEPTFVKDVLQLKHERDSSTHGGSASREVTEDKVRWLRKVVGLLLPDFSYLNSQSVADTKGQCFEARSDLLEQMGYGLFINLSSAAQDHLIRARLALVAKDTTEDSTLLIGHLCAALEAEFRRHIQDMTIHGLSDEALFEKIYQRFDELNIAPPDVLMQTQGMRFRKALQISDKTTLGASVLAWMLSIDFDLLKAIVSGCPTLFSDMSKLIDLRDHLNKKTVLAETEIQQLFDSACGIINTINVTSFE